MLNIPVNNHGRWSGGGGGGGGGLPSIPHKLEAEVAPKGKAGW